MSRFRFQPRFVTTLVAATGIATTLALANWQLNRAHEKEALAARLEALSKDAPATLAAAEVKAEDVQWRRGTASRRFEPRYAPFIHNRDSPRGAGEHAGGP